MQINSSEPKRIFLCTLSGVRNTESIAAEGRQYIPFLWDELRPQGVLYDNVIDENLQFHMPSVQCINTGCMHKIYYQELIPTIFEYIRKNFSLPASKVWSIGMWHKNTASAPSKDMSADGPEEVNVIDIKVSNALRRALSPELINKLVSCSLVKKVGLSEWPLWDSIGQIQFEILKRLCKVYQPVLVHYVFNATDCAHYGSFGRYVIAVRKTDEQLRQLWQMIQTEPFYKDKTYLIVTSDHQRNRYYMQHDQYDRPRKTWLYVYGPDIKKDTVITRPVNHADIFPTIASKILQMQTHQTEGVVLADAFV